MVSLIHKLNALAQDTQQGISFTLIHTFVT